MAETPVISEQKLVQLPITGDWYLPGKMSGYTQKIDLLDWEDVLANESVKTSLHNNSGLCFLMDPWNFGTEKPNPDYYFGHSNGLSFLTPKTFVS